LTFVHHGLPQSAAENRFNFERLAEAVTQQFGLLPNQRIDIHDSWDRRLLACEGRSCRSSCAPRSVATSHRNAILREWPVGDLDLQHFEVSSDDEEKVVEIVRDPAGELPQRFHLLGLVKQRFLLLAHGDVEQDRGKEDQTIDVEPGDRCFRRKFGAALAAAKKSCPRWPVRRPSSLPVANVRIQQA
jgi:hypothetical protein